MSTNVEALARDLWHLAGLHSGRELPCTSAKTALLYALSPRTQAAVAKSYGAHGRAGGGFVDLRIVGPVADDGAELFVAYRLTRRAWEGLDAAEREALRGLVGVEPDGTGAASAGFRVALGDRP